VQEKVRIELIQRHIAAAADTPRINLQYSSYSRYVLRYVTLRYVTSVERKVESLYSTNTISSSVE
jgi:hypothetical protein